MLTALQGASGRVAPDNPELIARTDDCQPVQVLGHIDIGPVVEVGAVDEVDG